MAPQQVRLLGDSVLHERHHHQPARADNGLLFDIAGETLLTIGGDPKHLGARLGVTLVLHRSGSAITHHPHEHGLVPGGGLAVGGSRLISCRRGFFLPVCVLSRLFRRRFLEALQAHCDARPQFLGAQASLADAQAAPTVCSLGKRPRVSQMIVCSLLERAHRGPPLASLPRPSGSRRTPALPFREYLHLGWLEQPRKGP